jgi:hypothetical protein
MQLPLDELDRRLVSLDETIILLRNDPPTREDLLAAIAPAADGILELAGPHRDYVSARLLSIMIANDLAPATPPVLE